MESYLQLLSEAFARVRAKETNAEEIGILNIESGRLVATDPLANPDGPAFERLVPPGSYRVVALYDEYESISAAVLILKEAEPAIWQMATIPGQDLESLEEGFYFGYGVDAGMGCFMDAEAYAFMQAREAREEAANPEYSNYYDSVVRVEMGNEDLDHFAHHPMPEQSRLNVIMFSSGMGDGVYASYWGLDANGEPVALITDFALEDEDENDDDDENEGHSVALDPEQEDDFDQEDDDFSDEDETFENEDNDRTDKGDEPGDDKAAAAADPLAKPFEKDDTKRAEAS